MSHQHNLSDHCLINHFEKVEGKPRESFHPKMLVGLPLLFLDRKMHFNGLRGGIWRAIGVNRSPSNPNICTL